MTASEPTEKRRNYIHRSKQTTSSDDVVSTSGAVVSGVASSDVEYIDMDVATEALSSTLQSFVESPLAPGITRRKHKLRNKLVKSSVRLDALFTEAAGTMTIPEAPSLYYEWGKKILETIQQRISSVSTKMGIYTMLTCLPQTVTITQMVADLNISTHMARNGSAFRTASGPFYAPEYNSSAPRMTQQVEM
ncbi:unnamed protein product [Orchesella dallaii]|uniref:Uncharacterized protein n=1 Tax=Orchesella dallaii TaxID=48710 RepID=A0ABP1PTL2_9HEXA